MLIPFFIFLGRSPSWRGRQPAPVASYLLLFQQSVILCRWVYQLPASLPACFYSSSRSSSAGECTSYLLLFQQSVILCRWVYQLPASLPAVSHPLQVSVPATCFSSSSRSSSAGECTSYLLLFQQSVIPCRWVYQLPASLPAVGHPLQVGVPATCSSSSSRASSTGECTSYLLLFQQSVIHFRWVYQLHASLPQVGHPLQVSVPATCFSFSNRLSSAGECTSYLLLLQQSVIPCRWVYQLPASPSAVGHPLQVSVPATCFSSSSRSSSAGECTSFLLLFQQYYAMTKIQY